MSKKNKDGDFLKKTIDAATTKEGMGTIGGAAVGGWIGSSVGIAALGTAVAGTLPIAVVGGAVGYLAVKAFGDDDKKKK
jgi:outer membrane lipoprotein SlyB|tara:strand:- start:133 stop:369 length:237 start_codon:yes stop_codon:yes gene_type:complete